MRARTSLLARAAASVTTIGLLFAGAAVLTAGAAQAALQRVETPFAYEASAYGTRVLAGNAEGSVGSGRTAWAFLGCTRMAPSGSSVGAVGGKVSQNSMLDVGVISSTTSSYRRPVKKLFGARSLNRVTDITLGDPAGAHLSIGTLTTVANAFNRRGRFAAGTSIRLLDLDIAGVVPEEAGPLQDFVDAIEAGRDQAATAVLEQAGQLDIPGVGTVHLQGWEGTATRAHAAVANAFGIRVELENGSVANIGRAWAKIIDNAPAGAFSGRAYAAQASAADGVVSLGRTVEQPLPCAGTGGRWRTNAAAHAGNEAAVLLQGLKAATYGLQRDSGSAVARASAEVAKATLGGGQLVISGVKGQANVVQDRRGRITARSARGTTVGSITADGETHAIPNPGQTLEIPGVARITPALTTRTKRGVRVVALRVQLLDGTGATVNLGVASVRIGR